MIQTRTRQTSPKIRPLERDIVEAVIRVRGSLGLLVSLTCAARLDQEIKGACGDLELGLLLAVASLEGLH